MTKYILIFSFVLGSLAFAQSDVSQAEIDLFLEAIKEKEVADRLLESPQLQECKASLEGASPTAGKSRNDLLRECVASKLEGLDPTALEEIAERLDLKNYLKNKATSTETILDYLNQRLSEAIYGKEEAADKLKNLKSKSTDHMVFYKFYQEQIGKNTLLTVSQYCLENFGFDDPAKLVYPIGRIVNVNGEEKLKFTNVYYYDGLDIDGDKYKVQTDLNHEKVQNIIASYEDPSIPKLQNVEKLSAPGFWSMAREYPMCSGKLLPNPTGDCRQNSGGPEKRNLQLTEEIKKAELLIGGSSDNQKYTQEKYIFCAKDVIKNMCEKYKCKNIYTNDTPAGDQANPTLGTRNYCIKELGITQFDSSRSQSLSSTSISSSAATFQSPAEQDISNIADLGEGYEEGALACNILQRLKEFRASLELTRETEEDFGNSSKVLLGLRNNVQKYNGSNGEKTVNELTSIASSKFDSVRDLDQSERATELKDRCLDEVSDGVFKIKSGLETDPDCQELIADTLSADEVNRIRAEAEADTALVIKSVKELTNREEISEFLTANGLSEIANREDFESMPEQELQQMVADFYKNRKKSELDAIRQRFEMEISGPSSSTFSTASGDVEITTEDNVASRTIQNMEQHKSRIQNLYQYSNIVSSYLRATEEGANPSADNSRINTVSRDQELEELSDDADTSYLQNYIGSSDGNSSGSSSGGNESFDYIGVLDTILGLND